MGRLSTGLSQAFSLGLIFRTRQSNYDHDVISHALDGVNTTSVAVRSSEGINLQLIEETNLICDTADGNVMFLMMLARRRQR